MDLALRPMSTAQVLDRTFQLYRSNFILFAGIASLTPAILLVLQALGLLGGAAGGNQTTQANPVVMPNLSPAYLMGIGVGVVLFLAVFLLGYVLTTGATIFAVSRVHLGKEATIGGCYAQIRPFVGKLILVVILTFLIMFAASVALIFLAMIPGIALGAAGVRGGFLSGLLTFVLFVAAIVLIIRLAMSISLAAPACVLEKLGPIDSITRSRVLAKGSLFRIFLLYLLAGIIVIALSMALSIPNIMAGPAPTAYRLPLAIWSIVAGFLAGTLAGPVGSISTALVYYDQRVRKEAFDLQLMMEAVGIAQPGQAQAQAAGGSAPSIG